MFSYQYVFVLSKEKPLDITPVEVQVNSLIV